MKNLLKLLIIVLVVASCESKKSDPIASLKEQIASKPSDSLFVKLNEEYVKSLNNKRLTAQEKENLMESAYGYFMEKGKYAYGANYLSKLIKDFPGDKTQPRIKELVNVFDKKGSKSIGDLLKMLYVGKYPDDEKFKNKYIASLSGVETNFDTILKQNGEIIFGDLEKTGRLNIAAAKDYVNKCEAFVLVNPENPNSPEYLFKAAEVAHTIKSLNKTFDIYDWILEKYPNAEKAPTTLFLKAYIVDNEIKDYKKAEKLYDEFLEKYPKSDLVDDVKTMKKYIGKSDEEILKMIEENQKKNQKKNK